MKKLNNIIDSCIVFMYEIKWSIPYNKARILLGYELYKKSKIYAIIEVIYGKAYAQNAYTNCDYWKIYIKQISFCDILKCIFIPFSIIDYANKNSKGYKK